MNRDIGAGFCLIFSGFITTSILSDRQVLTWVAIVAFASGLFLMLSPPIGYLCGWEALEDSGSASEKQSLLKGQGAEAQTKTDPGLVPEDALALTQKNREFSFLSV